MIYCDFGFEINEQGLLFRDKPDPDETHMVRISSTTFQPGDKFTLELDEFGRMFFRKDTGENPTAEFGVPNPTQLKLAL